MLLYYWSTLHLKKQYTKVRKQVLFQTFSICHFRTKKKEEKDKDVQYDAI